MKNVKKAVITTEYNCDLCGKQMVIKWGRFGKFLACMGFPECKYTKSIPTGYVCPAEGCGGELVRRQSKGRRVFYGCSNYPKCDFVSWNKPANKACTACGNNYLLEKYTKAKGNFLQCPDCKNITSLEESTV